MTYRIEQGRIKASAGPGAVPNAGPLQTYNQLTTPTNCGPPETAGPGAAAPLAPPLMRHWNRGNSRDIESPSSSFLP